MIRNLALRSIVEDLGRLKVTDQSGRYVIEYSPGAIQSNGMIDRAIQSVSGQVRVLLSALEESCGRMIPYDHPTISYIVELKCRTS